MTDNVYDPIGWRFCVAPMLDLTDRHCRYFHRLLSHRARLYTEMVTTGALVHGDVPHHLDFSEAEHRVALQLGGSDPKDLALGAKLAQQWGYDEVNLNCGCPSERVQKGSFGACLMAEPGLVADCVKAMQDATHLPVTIKHRVGIDANNDYGFVRDFVGTLFNAGVLLLDKPVGLSSNSALQKARRLLNAQKAGHTGTLDPLASGLLPLCFGEATKFSADLLNADKEYLTTVKFGEKTSTGDAEGEVIFSAEPKFTFKEFCAVLERFRGEIIQIPPMYSALKKDGVPLYKFARKGEEIEREPRKVVISSLDIVDFQPPEVTLLVRCSKGTYIRTLGEDIGEALGCGAHLKTLRRTAIADLHIEEAVDLDLFERMTEEQRIAVLLPPDRLLQSLAPVKLDEEATKKFLNGMKVRTDERSIEEAKVRVYGISAEKTEFLLGVGRLTSDGVLAPDRLISFVDNDR